MWTYQFKTQYCVDLAKGSFHAAVAAKLNDFLKLLFAVGMSRGEVLECARVKCWNEQW